MASEPERQALAQAGAELSVTMAKLHKVQAELKQAEDKLAKLEADYNEAVAKQN